MKFIILAGGLGTRISEETHDKPKPMVMINGKPILFHLIESLASQFELQMEFVIALGYKGNVVVDWLTENMNLEAIDSSNGHQLNCFFSKAIERPSKIWTIETGEDSLTGERVKRCIEAFPDEQYLVTYGDGLANIDLKALINFHENHDQLATITAVHPPARFGHLNIADDLVTSFGEKNQMLEGWINGGYFILNQSVRNFFNEKNESFEFDVLPRIVESNQLRAYKHQGFWHAMDTLRDKIELESLAKLSPPPWQK